MFELQVQLYQGYGGVAAVFGEGESEQSYALVFLHCGKSVTAVSQLAFNLRLGASRSNTNIACCAAIKQRTSAFFKLFIFINNKDKHIQTVLMRVHNRNKRHLQCMHEFQA